MKKHYVHLFLAVCLSIFGAKSAWSSPLPNMDDLIAATDQQAMAADVLAVGCIHFPLSDSVKTQQCVSPVGSRIDLARTVDKAVSAARNDIAQHYTPKNEATMRAMVKKAGFQLAKPLDATEALALYDFMVNRVMTGHLLQGLGVLITHKTIDISTLEAFVKTAETKIEQHIEATFYAVLRKAVANALKNKPQATHIIYASVGCGSATKDITLIAKLHTDFPSYEIIPYCIDPYQTPKGHPIAKAGILDTSPLAEGERILPRLQKHFDEVASVYVLSGHYAFHHLGQSFAVFRNASEGIPTVLYETTVTDEWYKSFIKRQTKIIYDIIMNHGFDQLHGSDWVADAATQNPDYFQVYYPNPSAIRAGNVGITITPVPASRQVIISY